MAQASKDKPRPALSQLTTDEWAVATALLLALLVRIGLIHKVPW